MSFWRTYYHIVWATSERHPLISTNIEELLFAYIVNKAGELGVFIFAIGGWVDHIHLVAAIPPKLAVSQVVKRLKGSSSRYINQALGDEYTFAWQGGYGILTLSESQRKVAEEYVRNQKVHHQQDTTNGWLEYAIECDEGPPNHGLSPSLISNGLKEPIANYHVEDELPF